MATLVFWVFSWIGELIVMAVAATPVAIVSVAIGYLFGLRKGRLIAVCGVAVVLLGFIPHLCATYALSPLKTEFETVARDVNVSRYDTGRVVDGRAKVALSYGGRLDEIVAKREQWLRRSGYLPASAWGWHVSEGGVANNTAP